MKNTLTTIWLMAVAVTSCLASAPPVTFGDHSFELPHSQRLAEIDRIDSPLRVIYELVESGERYVVIHHQGNQASDDAALLFARGYITKHVERFESEGRRKVGLLANRNYTLRKAPAILIATSHKEAELCHHAIVLRIDANILLLAHEGTSREGVVFLTWAQEMISKTYGMNVPIDLAALHQQKKG